MRFEFATAGRIIFGPGSLTEAGSIAAEFGKRALVVTGRNAERSAKLRQILQASGVESEVFAVLGEPEVATVEQGLALARSTDCDLVIGFGGGSSLDTGKAIAAMLTNPGALLDYLEIIGQSKPLTQASAPFIAVPTTAGTGAEATRNAVIASPEHKVKVSLRGAGMLPKLALVDPRLTLELPASMTASTGLDALTQLLEAYVCTRANPMTDALCEQGLKRVSKSLRRAFVDGSDESARGDMALSALYSGIALANAGLGAVHGFAGPIGGMRPGPHGATCAALLPQVVRVNLRALREREPRNPALARYEQAARLLTKEPLATADDGLAWLQALASDLKVAPLSAYGLGEADCEAVIAKAAKASSMKPNPIVLTNQELTDIYLSALDQGPNLPSFDQKGPDAASALSTLPETLARQELTDQLLVKTQLIGLP